MRFQREVMRVIDRHVSRKVLSAELQVAQSELSRWASGERHMPVDRLGEVLRLARAEYPELARELLALVTEEVGPSAPPAAPEDLLGAVLDVVDRVGRVSAEVSEARRDGTIDEIEIERIEDAAREAAAQAETLLRAVRRARSLRTA